MFVRLFVRLRVRACAVVSERLFVSVHLRVCAFAFVLVRLRLLVLFSVCTCMSVRACASVCPSLS